MPYDINFGSLSPYLNQFLGGFGVTVEISVLALALSMPLGLGGALLRTSNRRILAIPAGVYVEVLRNVPLLVVVYFVFYGLPGIGIRLEAFTSGLLALTANSTAYVVEIFRGSLRAISKGQYEAAHSLGMKPHQVFAHVVLPQLLRISFPALGNQVVGLILGSSLVSVVAIPELTLISYKVGSITFRYFEVFVLAAVLYFMAVQLISRSWGLIGRRWIADLAVAR